ncbi:MAG: sensor histidine kinase [Solirubrobacterales bacterium]
MKSLPIRLQLSVVVSLLTLLIIAVLSVAAYIEFEESLLANIDATVRYMAEAILAELHEEEVSTGNQRAAFRAITGYGSSGYESQCRIWIDGDGEDLFTSDSSGVPLALSLRRLPVEERPEMEGFSFLNVDEDVGSGGEVELRAIWMRHRLKGRVVNILVARSSRQVYHELWEFLQLLLVSGGSITLITLLLVPRIISWGLRPITDAGAQMEQITHRSLGQESPMLGDVPVELRPFQSALDGMLARLNTAMRQQEQFTADAAHELRTPLATMKSTLQTLQIRPRTIAEYQESVHDTLRDIGRMERLVQQLLTLARLDATDKISDPEEIRLDVLLQSVADVFIDRAEQQGAHLVYEQGSAVSVQGNETELRQVFSNLLDNALRYGPSDGVVRVTLQDGPDSWVTTNVHDEGGAIPAEKLPRLFDRFYRVEDSRSELSGGTGLGLAIAREIVLRHHGDITITSDPQTGTSVVVRLPRNGDRA